MRYLFLRLIIAYGVVKLICVLADINRQLEARVERLEHGTDTLPH